MGVGGGWGGGRRTPNPDININAEWFEAGAKARCRGRDSQPPVLACLLGPPRPGRTAGDLRGKDRDELLGIGSRVGRARVRAERSARAGRRWKAALLRHHNHDVMRCGQPWREEGGGGRQVRRAVYTTNGRERGVIWANRRQITRGCRP